MSAGLLLSLAVRENLFQTSLPASAGLLSIFAIPWLVEASPWSLSSCSRGVIPVCVSVSKFPPRISMPIIPEWGSTLLQYARLSTNYICNDPIYKHSHVLKY